MADQWKETKKEFEYNENNERILKKVTQEYVDETKRKRENWEFVFKTFSALGILISLLGIWVNVVSQKRQSQAQEIRDNRIFDNGIYKIALKDLYVIGDDNVSDSAKTNAVDNYFSEVTPALSLVSNDTIRCQFQKSDSILRGWRICKNLYGNFNKIDSFVSEIPNSLVDTSPNFDLEPLYLNGYKFDYFISFLQSDSLKQIYHIIVDKDSLNCDSLIKSSIHKLKQLKISIDGIGKQIPDLKSNKHLHKALKNEKEAILNLYIDQLNSILENLASELIYYVKKYEQLLFLTRSQIGIDINLLNSKSALNP